MDAFTLEKLEFDQIRQILARYCRCSLGKSLALRINPSRRPETIRQWLAQTQEMFEALREAGTPPYGGITDITEAVGRAMPAGGAGGADYADIAATLAGSAEVKNWLNALDERHVQLRGLAEGIESFQTVVEAIRAVVDERGEVRDSASERLAAIRLEIDQCQQRIREVVYRFARRADVAAYLQSTAVQLHEDRYVLPVKAENRGRLAGVVHRSSHTGATVFIEPAECVQLNNRLVALGDEQREEIARLLAKLALKVHARYDDILRTLRTLATLDLIAAKAQYAYQFEMACPQIDEGGALQFYQARHPLLIEQAWRQEAAGLPPEQRHPVVPIDIRLGREFDLLIITGSNTGGKTIAMKTLGLLVLMVQSGLFAPAQRGCTMPVFRDVLIDVGDEQSLQQSLSTFGGHLKRIKSILQRADRHSLVLLDELGSGTDPEEGGAIGQAILDELRAKGSLGVVTTHLGVLKAYAYNHERAENASVAFDTQTLRPTYHLLIGEPGESHAISVARHYGLPKRVIRSAQDHLPRQHNQLRRAIRATTASRRASEEALKGAEAARAQALGQQELYQAKLDELTKLSQQFNEWVGSLPAMQPGDQVFVRRLNKYGRLVRMQLSKQIAVVQVDKMDVEVPLQELMPDLGDTQVREEIATLRRQIAAQAKTAETIRQQAEHAQQEYHRSLANLRARQQQFDAWRDRIGKLAVGDEVTFSRPPGRGTVVALDLPAGRVEVETGGQTPQRLMLRWSELFPHVGQEARPGGRGSKGKPRPQQPRSRPIPHRRPDSKAGKANRQAVLQTPPGRAVYVVPFQKRATLVRVDADKDVAIVSSGAFEMELPLADIEPVTE